MLIGLLAAALLLPYSPEARNEWQQIDDGLFLGEFAAQNEPNENRLKITILKVDPDKYQFTLLCASEQENGPLTTKEWARRFDLIIATNAGMYQEDNLTSAGYMKNYSHTNNPGLNRYKAVLAFNRTDPNVPPIQIIDRECQDFDDLKTKYATLFQGIRMISCDGKNVWKQQPDKWRTAAVGIDTSGNALFIFCRTPSSVHDLINALLSLPISIHNAMYLEGGPPASLYLSGTYSDEDVEVDLHGADDFIQPGAVPNVLGVLKK